MTPPHINEGKQMRHFSLATKTRLIQQWKLKHSNTKRRISELPQWMRVWLQSWQLGFELPTRPLVSYPSRWRLGVQIPAEGLPFLLKLCEDSKKPWWLLFRPVGRVTKPPQKNTHTQKKKKKANNENFSLPIKH